MDKLYYAQIQYFEEDKDHRPCHLGTQKGPFEYIDGALDYINDFGSRHNLYSADIVLKTEEKGPVYQAWKVEYGRLKKVKGD